MQIFEKLCHAIVTALLSWPLSRPSPAANHAGSPDASLVCKNTTVAQNATASVVPRNNVWEYTQAEADEMFANRDKPRVRIPRDNVWEYTQAEADEMFANRDKPRVRVPRDNIREYTQAEADEMFANRDKPRVRVPRDNVWEYTQAEADEMFANRDKPRVPRGKRGTFPPI